MPYHKITISKISGIKSQFKKAFFPPGEQAGSIPAVEKVKVWWLRPMLWHHSPAAHTGRCCICRTPPSLQTPAAGSRRTRSRRRHSRGGRRLVRRGWTIGWWLRGEGGGTVYCSGLINRIHTVHCDGPHSLTDHLIWRVIRIIAMETALLRMRNWKRNLNHQLS